MASAWGSSFGTAWGNSWGATGGVTPPAVVATVVKRGAPRTGGWNTERLYLPPGKWTKKRKTQAINAVKRLYEEARREIPEEFQRGLLPDAVLSTGRTVYVLPSPAQIDFAALAQSLETIRVLIAALEAQRKRRRREEEALLMLLAELL